MLGLNALRRRILGPGRGDPVLLRELRDLRHPWIEALCRARARAVPLPDGTLLCRTLGRHKLRVSALDREFSPHVALDGFWEIWLTRLFASRVRRGMCCVDVGAQAGYFTLLLADLVGPEGRVHAVEPLPSNVALLSGNIALNGFLPRVSVHAVALGSEPAGEIALRPAYPGSMNAARVPDGMPDAPRVPATTLDRLLGDVPRLDVVKIDAEGAEHAILEGAEALLAKHRPLLVAEVNAARAGDMRAMLERLARIYPALATLESDGTLRPATVEALLGQRVGLDHLVVALPDATRV
ncbi:MAG: FkbM family methyltransferase [Acetobacteraceae bacterium]|nr:FkbM family methyltransferase [Acetobacteraceae bacterium]